MAKITVEVPDELTDQLAQIGDRLPELLALSLQQPPRGNRCVTLSLTHPTLTINLIFRKFPSRK